MRRLFAVVACLALAWGCGSDGGSSNINGPGPVHVLRDSITVVVDSGWVFWNNYAALFVDDTGTYDIMGLPATIPVKPQGQHYRLSAQVQGDSGAVPTDIDSSVTTYMAITSHPGVWAFVSEGTLDTDTLWVF